MTREQMTFSDLAENAKLPPEERMGAGARARFAPKPPTPEALSVYLTSRGFGALHVARASKGCRWPSIDVPVRIMAAVTRGACVVLCGPTGVGKGQLCASLAYRLVRDRWPSPPGVRRTTFVQWVRSLFTTAPGADPLRPWTAGVDLMVLDEIHHTAAGAGEAREPGKSHTVYERGRLFELLDRRYEAVQATILTTNLSPDLLAQALDAPVLDRIRESGEVIDLSKWPNQREVRP